MIPNRFYRIPPFSVKLEITRVEVGKKRLKKRFLAKLTVFCHEQKPMSREN